jgi:hypothetical protein
VSHGLNTSTNTNLNQTRLDGSCDLNTSLKTRRALTVGSVKRSGIGEASMESSHTSSSGTTTSGQDIANADILNQSRVDLCLFDGSLEDSGEYL